MITRTNYIDNIEPDSNNRIVKAVIVSDIIDRFKTVINPRGMKTDPSLVTIGYNHNKCKGVPVNTGASLLRVYVEKDYKYTGVDGKEQTINEALIGEIEVPPTAKKNYCYPERSNNQKNAGSLLEAINNKEIKSVSIGAFPTKTSTIQRDGKTYEYIEEWDLRELSFLDVTSGQQNSSITIIRMNKNNKIERCLCDADLSTFNVGVSPDGRMAEVTGINLTTDNASYEVKYLDDESTATLTKQEAEAWSVATTLDIFNYVNQMATERACGCSGSVQPVEKKEEETRSDNTESKEETPLPTPEVKEEVKEEETTEPETTEEPVEEEIRSTEPEPATPEATEADKNMNELRSAISSISEALQSLTSEIENMKKSEPKVDLKEMERSIIENLKEKTTVMPTGVPVEADKVGAEATIKDSGAKFTRIFGRK